MSSAVSFSVLEDWLDRDPDRFEQYLIDHPEVAERFEAVTKLPDHVRTALDHAFDVPTDIAVRLRARLMAFTGTETPAVVMDLFGVGVETMRILFERPDH
jgi:hypothetical protein